MTGLEKKNPKGRPLMAQTLRKYQQLIQLVLDKANNGLQIAWGGRGAADRAGAMHGQALQQAATGEHVLARQLDPIDNGLGRDGIDQVDFNGVGIHILKHVVLVSCVQRPAHATLAHVGKTKANWGG